MNTLLTPKDTSSKVEKYYLLDSDTLDKTALITHKQNLEKILIITTKFLNQQDEMNLFNH